MTGRQKSLAGGISILGIAGLICKVVGVLYQIPLNNSIGPEGMGVYNLVFPTYNLLLSISTVGIPVAISRMVAQYLAQEDPRNAGRVFKTSLLILSLFGAVATAFMMLSYQSLGRATATAESSLGFLVIAPSLFLVSVMSAFRGFMQGKRRMVPTAISQLIEQVGKVFIALPFAVLGMRRGGYAMGAAGALLGTSIAEAAALAYMMADYYIHRKDMQRLPQISAEDASAGSLAREITLISIPITIGASIVPLAGLVDSFMLKRIMQGYMEETQALISYGVYSGPVISLINVPTALAAAISANLVPAISHALTKKRHDKVAQEAATGLRLASVIGFPCSIGLSLLAEPVLFLLFGRGGKYTAEQLRLGARLLEISSLTILFFIQVQATSAILQALRRQRIPMYTLALGVAVKMALNYSLVAIPAVGIRGAPYASLLCYIVSFIPNLYYVRKHTDMKLNLSELMWRPMMAAAVMAAVLIPVRWGFGAELGRSWLYMLALIALSVLVYFAAALRLKAIMPQDMPGFIRKRMK